VGGVRPVPEGAFESALGRAMFAAGLDAVVTMDADGRILDLNPAAERMFGYARDDAIGRRVADTIVPPSLRDAHRAGLERFLSTGEGPVLGTRIEITAMRAGGEEFPVELAITRLDLPGPPVFAGSIRDLTEQRRASQQLAAGEQRLRALLDASSDGIFVIDRDWNMLLMNRSGSELSGRGPEEIDAATRWEAIHPDDRDRVRGAFEALEPGHTVDESFRLRRRDGSYRWVEIRIRNAFDDPSVNAYVTTLRDITTRMESEAALRDAEARYRSLIEQIPAATYIEVEDDDAPNSFRGVYMSPQIEPMLGCTPAEWTADSDLWARLLHPADRDRALIENEAASRERRPFHLRYRMRALDGRVVWVLDDSRPVLDPNGLTRIRHGVMFDVTEEEESRERLRGLLAQVVAAEEKERRTIAEGIHDDPIQKMTAVAMRLSALGRQLTDETQLAAVDRIAETVSATIARLRLLLFELHPRSLETGRLEDAIQEYLDLSLGIDGFDYALDMSLDRPLPQVVRTTAYRIVQEALANVRKHSGAEHVEITLKPTDGGLYGSVRDDGVGLGERAEADVPGHMGLAGMRERAERAGGWARIGRADGRGTLVEFWLPTELAQPSSDDPPPTSRIVSTTAE
jgi:PAS domain S-box-containing protein